MVGRKVARKALAGALSQVVLSRETIQVHAESVLDHAELIEGSLHSSALNLWFAVLRRAEAERAVERLVASVLEDNPGADALRVALRDWQLASALPGEPASPLLEEAPPESASPASASSRAARGARRLRAGTRSEQVRWLVLTVVGVGIAWLFVRGRPEPIAEPAEQARRTAALRARALPPEEMPPEEMPPPVDAGSEQESARSRQRGPDGVQKKGQ
jgi:Effector-associated domain 1